MYNYKYNKYEMNYMLSYPRTGSSFIRYCVEEITGKKTLDCGWRDDMLTNVTRDNGILLTKEHSITNYLVPDKILNLILVLRNYKDVYISHDFRDVSLSESNLMCDKFLTDEIFHKHYYSLINFYDKFEGPKIVIYYEDLIVDNSIIRNILNFLLPDETFDDNDDIINTLSLDSKSKYKESVGFLKTSEVKVLNSIFTDEQNSNIDTLFRNFDVEMYDKYLNRYLYKNN